MSHLESTYWAHGCMDEAPQYISYCRKTQNVLTVQERGEEEVCGRRSDGGHMEE